jgi:hypothetical protein
MSTVTGRQLNLGNFMRKIPVAVSVTKISRISNHNQHNFMSMFIKRRPVSAPNLVTIRPHLLNSLYSRNWINRNCKSLSSRSALAHEECMVKTVQYVDISIYKNFIPSILLPTNSHPILTQTTTQHYLPHSAVTLHCTSILLPSYIYFFTFDIFNVASLISLSFYFI